MTTKPCCKKCLPNPEGGFTRDDGTRMCGRACDCHWATATPEIKHHSLSPGATLPTYYTGGSMIEIVPEHSLDFSEPESKPCGHDDETHMEYGCGAPESVPAQEDKKGENWRRGYSQGVEEGGNVVQLREQVNTAFKDGIDVGRRAMREEILALIKQYPYSHHQTVQEVCDLITSTQ